MSMSTTPKYKKGGRHIGGEGEEKGRSMGRVGTLEGRGRRKVGAWEGLGQVVARSCIGLA